MIIQYERYVIMHSQAGAWERGNNALCIPKQELGNEVERLKEIENSFVSRSQAPAWECI